MISENLRRLRIANGYTQQQLAEYLCISNQSISKWERGDAMPSTELLPKIAEFLHCSINALFSDYEAEIFIRLAENQATLEEQLSLAYAVIESLSKGDTEESQQAIETYPELSLPLESLFLPALKDLLEKVEYVTPAVIQRELKVGYYVASQMTDGLQSLGIAEWVKGKGAKVDKEKISRLDPYIKNV